MPTTGQTSATPAGGLTSPTKNSVGTETLRLNLSTQEIFDHRRTIYDKIGLPPAASPVPAAVSLFSSPAHTRQLPSNDSHNQSLTPSASTGTAFSAPASAAVSTPSNTASAPEWEKTSELQKSSQSVRTSAKTQDLAGLIDFKNSIHYESFASPKCSVTRTETDKSSIEEWLAPNYMARKLEKTEQATIETVRDRYGRLIYEKKSIKRGSWSAREIKYQDKDGKRSPFIAFTRVVASDGILKETSYGINGVTEEKELKLSPADLLRPI